MAVKKSFAQGKGGKAARWGAAGFKLRRESSSSALIGSKGTIGIESLVRRFGFSRLQLAATTGLSLETLYRPKRVSAAKTQARLKEMLEIVDRVSDWAGGKDQAMAWYRAEPIAAFGGRTAEALVKEGRAGDVRDYLDHVALGGFA